MIASESKLANKLFDACHITGADNGRTLPQMYQSALDMLTPKLNAKIAEAKNLLRQLLMTPYTYDFGDGKVSEHTLQQVFYHLYDDYVAQKEELANKQTDKKAELRKKHPADDEANNEKCDDEYLTWYEGVAEAYTENLNEQRGKILAVFSPNDMKIIKGILDAGSGAEPEEAREALENTRKMDPDGGYVYPVSLYPENWFELLDNSFMGTDLLESPAALSESLSLLLRQRNNLTAQINQITEAIPSDDAVKAAKDAVTKAQGDMDTASADLVKSYGEGAKTALQAALQIAAATGTGGVAAGVLSRLAGSVEENDETKKQGLIKGLTDAIGKGTQAQTALVNAGNALAEAAMNYITTKNLENLKAFLSPLKGQLETVNGDINSLTEKIKLVQQVIPDDAKDAKDAKTPEAEELMPRKVPKGFTQITMESDASSMDQSTAKSAAAKESNCGVNLLFAGYSRKKSESESAYASFSKDTGMKIQVGLSVAKVSIEREWFNPGVFLLSQGFCNVTTQKFAPPPPTDAGDSEDFAKPRFDRMKDCVFPCYPTAFVVARDVTVRFTSTNNISDSAAKTVESHASQGGGFLCFSGSKSSSSSASSSSVHTQTNSKSITIRFTDPQILGYYLEATPPDMSVSLDNVSKDKDTDTAYVTIMDFVKKYKEMLDDYNKTYGGGNK